MIWPFRDPDPPSRPEPPAEPTWRVRSTTERYTDFELNVGVSTKRLIILTVTSKDDNRVLCSLEMGAELARFVRRELDAVLARIQEPATQATSEDPK